MSRTITFRHCWVHTNANFTETVYPDGSRVTATPEDSEEYRQKATCYGYGVDTAALSREHEILHTFLAERLRDGCSHALWAVAHGQQEEIVAPLWEQEIEESLVLAFQIYLNGGPNDHPALYPIREAGFEPPILKLEAEALLRSASNDW